MTNFFSRLSPVPSFPAYKGPYKVGTIDVELPISVLHSPSFTPPETSNIKTVLFRVFYPADPDSPDAPITWIPSPQRQTVQAYAELVRLGSFVSGALGHLLQHLRYATIPAHKNAKLAALDGQRWPTAIFSHGLASSRNVYSYTAGALASHGVVVFCPEHREGSAIITYLRDPETEGGKKHGLPMPFEHISHDPTPEVFEARDRQLTVRLWELGLLHDAMLAVDKGTDNILDTNLNTSTTEMMLKQFSGKLDIHEPGSIIFAGHSFGGATMVQFIKSTYYAGRPEVAGMERVLFKPDPESEISRQITAKSVVILLDMWMLPITSPATRPLFDLPLPAYDRDVPDAPGGRAILAIESKTFYEWKEHLHEKARTLSPNPSEPTVSPELYDRGSAERFQEPNFFYAHGSVHMSQSDFGVLFPWMTRKLLKAADPQRILRLNLRAQLQFLRKNGLLVAPTSMGDMTEGPLPENPAIESVHDDVAILDKENKSQVQHWEFVDLHGMGDPNGNGDVVEPLKGTEQEMADEIEPGAIKHASGQERGS